MKYTTITYVGRNSGYIAKVGKITYEFEWNKSLGIGGRNEEVRLEHVHKIAKWRDKKGKKIFVLE
jgi:hypothetical protein